MRRSKCLMYSDIDKKCHSYRANPYFNEVTNLQCEQCRYFTDTNLHHNKLLLKQSQEKRNYYAAKVRFYKKIIDG